MTDGDSPTSVALGASLVRVGQHQDQQAFKHLYEHFAPRLKGYMMSTGLAQDIAEDIAQEAMTNVWRRASQYDANRAAASTWIFTIARNVRTDRLRKHRFIEVPDDQVPPEQQTDASNLEVMTEYDQMQQRMKDLPDGQSSLLEMAYLEGHSHGEISQKTSLPLGTVKTRIRLAMKNLRAAWTKS